MNIIVYTALIRAYDVLQPPKYDDVEHICFTDQHTEVHGWERVVLTPEFSDARRESRRQKIQPHKYIPHADYTIYHDASMRLNVHPNEIIARIEEDDLMLFGHPHRDCVFEEAAICKQWGLDTEERIDKQMHMYESVGMQPHTGLYSGGVLVRRMNDIVAQFNDMWWHEFIAGSVRDQLGLAYTLWRFPIPFRILPGDIFNSPLVAVAHHTMRRG